MQGREDRPLVLDKCREDIIFGIAGTLINLKDGKLRGCNRFNQMILGRKYAGKSTLLTAVRSVCKKIFPSLLVVNVSCESEPFWGLMELALIHLNHVYSCDYKFQRFEDCLQTKTKQLDFAQKHEMRFVFLIDEFQEVYKASWDKTKSKEFVRSLAELLDSQSGRFFLIVSGSSELRGLAFAKLPRDSETLNKYPHYIQFDLNYTKLQLFYLHPFQDSESFSKLCESYNISEEDRLMAYYKSGGFPGFVTYQSDDCHSYGIACGFRDRELLRALVECSIIEQIDSKVQLDQLFNLITPVPLQWIDEYFGISYDRSIVYELMEDGWIIYNHSIKDGKDEIVFSSPFIYLEVLLKGKLTIQEVAANFEQSANSKVVHKNHKVLV